MSAGLLVYLVLANWDVAGINSLVVGLGMMVGLVLLCIARCCLLKKVEG